MTIEVNYSCIYKALITLFRFFFKLKSNCDIALNCVNKCTKQPLNQKSITFIIVKNFLTDGYTKQLQK